MFLRVLAVVYLLAFGSLALQVPGLIGQNGILPARDFMAAVAQWHTDQDAGLSGYGQWPTVFWLGTSDWFLQAVATGGALLAGMMALGVAPSLLLPVLWAAYLSLSVVSREFLGYQWDALLLETGLLAIPLAPIVWRHRRWLSIEPPRLARWLLWFLLFRLTFGSGIVKLASGDPSWWSLDAMSFHYETQPLPTPIAWYVSRLPGIFHKVTTATVLIIELAVPWLMFGPRRARHIACVIMLALQAAIALTGNYAFFNLLTMALCVLLIDNAAWTRIASRLHWRSFAAVQTPAAVAAPRVSFTAGVLLALLTVPVAVVGLSGQLGVTLPGSALVGPLMRLMDPLRSVNPYGLFAVMTTTRPEIVVEGSNDGVAWLPYEFIYKPGEPERRPAWVAPHQPRLDWQMWFAALGRYEEEAWYQSLCRRLLEGSPTVLRLIARDPFDGRPPRFVRGTLYRYRFADAATRRASGTMWLREELGPYSPPVSLSEQQRLSRAR